LKLTTTLTEIARAAEEKEAENLAFRSYLQSQNSDDIDELVQELDTLITPQIDCTSCGNCCRNLMINVTEDEVTALATHLNTTNTGLKEKYIETGSSNDMMIINTIPCHFLHESRCTIYEHRFAGCREFPALHLPKFNKRLFTTFTHYSTCLIIYNVVEEMKKRVSFHV